MKILASYSPGPSPRHRGAVLIIVLSFIVLLAGLVVAFFSRAVFDRQISNNSTNTTKTDTLAWGAINTVVGDLKQEMAAGSTHLNSTTASTTAIYAPLGISGGNQTAVPFRMPTCGTFANLIKQSAYNQSFYTGAYYDSSQYPVPSRAANVSSTTPALNQRYISLARWNKPLLLPKKTPTSSSNLTPDGNFHAPDWILISKSGSNVLTASTDIIGRYAYTIYDEGGLLDINVAGYPGSTPSSFTDFKNALSFADLTKIHLTQTQIDTLVGWRNYALLQPSGTFPNFTIPASSGSTYYSAAQGNSFIRTGTAALYNQQSDRMFCSRQELLKFIQSIGVSTDQAALQNAMQYIGTFSRDINQPSYVPSHIIDTTAPKVVGGDGGNISYGGDAVVNPAFLTVRATSSVVRNDGSTAMAGEPLVKKRFSLNRLAWITCKGPSARLASGDTVFQETAKALGWESAKATAWLKQGTDEAVLRYFGLSWDATNNRWNYSTHLTSKHISTLSEVAAANREPDFVELLKAAISIGSLGKGATRYNTTPAPPMPNASGVANAQAWEDYQFRQDISTDAHLLQIAANIIDQFDVDGFPTRIYFDDGTTVGTREIVGVENLPYFYRIRPSIVQAIAPIPAGTSGTAWNHLPDPIPYYSGTGTAPTGYSTLTETGLMAYLLQPELWNPHDQGSPRASASSLAPTDFRFVADSTSPDQIAASGSSTSYATASILTRSNGGSRTDFLSLINPVVPFDNGYAIYPISFTADNTEMDFNVTGNTSSLFAEPTLLFRPGIPTGSNLKLGSKHSIRQFTSPPLNGTFPKLTQAVASGSGEGIKSIQDNNTHIGMYMAVGPLRWLWKQSSTTSSVVSADDMGPSGTGAWANSNWDSGITFRVQCKDLAGNWVTYDQKYSQAGRHLHAIKCNVNADGSAGWNSDFALVGRDGWISCIDPRTSRFGMQGHGPSSGLPPPGYPYPYGGIPAPLNISQGLTYSNRWASDSGAFIQDGGNYGTAYGLPGASGWYPKLAGQYWTNGVPFYLGLFAQNSMDDASSPQYYADTDGVVRRGMAAFMSGNITTGQPLAIATGTTGTPTVQSQSRPMILNRPFRSVAEVGYVFTGTPWKNLDMFTPESGFASLLDVFCVGSEDPIVAGKVNLNTRQSLVLSAILSGAYKDEMTHYSTQPSWTLAALTSGEADTIASALVSRTMSSDVQKGPLRNMADLVGRWTGAITDSNGAINGQQSYHGFSEDLSSANASMNSISRLRETSMRALTGCGTTRVWNLMIDIIAQTGHYPPRAGNLAQFNVEGERRYWVHIAIDRYTGEVIDQNVELVRE